MSKPFFSNSFFDKPFFTGAFYQNTFFKSPYFNGLGIATPPPPDEINITDITASSARATWSKVPEATGYEIEVLNITDGGIFLPATKVKGLTKAITGLDTAKEYQAIVSSENANGTSATAIQTNFTTL